MQRALIGVLLSGKVCLKWLQRCFFLFLFQEKNCLQNIQIRASPTVLHSQTDTDHKSICNQKEQVSHPTSLVVFHILFPNDSMKFNKESIYWFLVKVVKLLEFTEKFVEHSEQKQSS